VKLFDSQELLRPADLMVYKHEHFELMFISH